MCQWVASLADLDEDLGGEDLCVNMNEDALNKTYHWIDEELVKLCDPHTSVVKLTKVLSPEVFVQDHVDEDVEENISAAIEGTDEALPARVELYDSGSTCHLSPLM